MSDVLKWAILGCGRIAGKFAAAIPKSNTGVLLGAASRSGQKAEAFAAEYKPERAYGSYEEMLADKDVQAVYIATPHTSHAKWTIKCAEAGKHILCEKPLAVTCNQAAQAVEAARRHDVFLMEALMYRCHPQTAALVELIRKDTIGDVHMIRAAFGFKAKFDPESRLFSNALAGGGILDVGCYPVSFSRLIAGTAVGKDVLEPEHVHAAGTLTETGVDAWSAAVLRFPGGIVAQVSTAVRAQLVNDAWIVGSEGSIEVPHPWQPGIDVPPTIIVHRPGEEPREIPVESENLYAYEADTVAAHLDRRQAPSPAMTWEDSLGNMKVLDAWRAAIGQKYEFEDTL